jgi:hypothetical protein
VSGAAGHACEAAGVWRCVATPCDCAPDHCVPSSVIRSAGIPSGSCSRGKASFRRENTHIVPNPIPVPCTSSSPYFDSQTCPYGGESAEGMQASRHGTSTGQALPCAAHITPWKPARSRPSSCPPAAH